MVTYLGKPGLGTLGSLADGFPENWTEIKPPSVNLADRGDPWKLTDVPLDDIPAKAILWAQFDEHLIAPKVQWNYAKESILFWKTINQRVISIVKVRLYY